MNIDALPRSAELLQDAGEQLILHVIDQAALPRQLVYVDFTTHEQTIEAIQTMVVRGAPLIGYCGACALALWAHNEASSCNSVVQFVEQLTCIESEVAAARPTAVNLASETKALLNAVTQAAKTTDDLAVLKRMMVAHCAEVARIEEEANRNIGQQGAELLTKNSTVLTHCNAGSLATVFYGTALGVIYTAATQDKIDRVYADETRPLGQGARLTAWELARVGIPTTLICDNMAASVMASGTIDAVIVGADRICANGDFANKIGAYGLAVLAKHHQVPFYVAAPRSSFDFTLSTGAKIPIEQRGAHEVISPSIPGVDVFNPAFDVTPAHLVTKFITETGIFDANNLDDFYKSN